MPYFTKKELIMSLFFPVILLLWGALDFVLGIPWDRDPSEISFGHFQLPLIGLVRLLVSGVLPIVLTLRLKIRTDSYFVMRLIVVVVVYFLNRLIEGYAFPFFSGDMTVTVFLLHLIVNVAAVILQILLFKRLDNTTKGELAVIALSDPFVWWAVHYFLMYV